MTTFHQRLTIYDDLDVPIDGAGISTCSTDPAHTRPYLILTLDSGDSEVNFLEGRSTIGQVNVNVLDKRTSVSDQTSGWFTAILSDTNGENKLAGRRVKLEQQDASGTYYSVFDGVVSEISLNDDLVTYTLITRDTRDNERAQPLFNTVAGTACVHPPGITNGYGTYVKAGGGTGQMVPPASVAKGTYKSDGVGMGHVVLDATIGQVTEDLYAQLYAGAVSPTAAYDSAGEFTGFVYANVIIRWRPEGVASWSYSLSNMPEKGNFNPLFPSNTKFYGDGRPSESSIGNIYMYWADNTSLPADNQRVEIQVLASMPPSETYPLWLEVNLGQLLKDIYDGVYSYNAAGVRYNAAAMDAFIAACPTARLRITAQEDDMRAWVEENIYKPMGYAPAINSDGEIVPVSMFLPDATVTPITLDDSNCRSAKWKHQTSDSVTRVTWTWEVDTVSNGLPSNTSYKPPKPIVDSLQTYEREDYYLSAAAAYINTREVTYNPVTFRDIDPLGVSYDPMLTNSTARQAQKVSRGLIDRLRYGGQHIVVSGAKRSDAGVANLKVGDWVVCGFSALPDYGTHKRGMSRLAQVIKIRDIDPLSRDLELLDSGPSGAPLALPTLTSVTISGQIATAAVVAVAGAEVAVEYAISVAQPTVGSNLWQRLGRGATGNYNSSPLPLGATIWMRARSEAIGKRPSAWTGALSVTVVATPMPETVDVTIDASGHAIVTWTPNIYMVGARVGYAITHLGGSVPPVTALPNYLDFAASAGTADLGITYPGDVISVFLEAWGTFSDDACSGTQGGYLPFVYTRPLDVEVIYPQPTHVMSEAYGVTPTGTLNVTFYDPQNRLSQVVFEAISGRDAAVSTTVLAPGPYSASVPLKLARIPSFIQYTVYGTDSNNNLDQVLFKSARVPFQLGNKPQIIEIDFSTDVDGNLTGYVTADTDSTSIKCLASTSQFPTGAEVDAATGVNSVDLTVSRTATFTDLLTGLKIGDKFFISARSYNGTSSSDLAPYSDIWTGAVGTTPSAAFGTFAPADTLITIPITLGAHTVECEVWTKEFSAEPNGVGAAASSVENIAASPYDVLVSDRIITIPILASTNWLMITLVPYDALGRRGTVVNTKVMGNGAISPPQAPSSAVNLFVTGTTQTSRVTMGAVPPAYVRIYRDGVNIGDVAVTVGAGAAQDIVHSGLTPGQTYTWQFSGVTGGVESIARTTIFSATCSTLTIDTPTITNVTYSTVDQAIVVTIAAGANTPSGAIFHVGFYSMSGASDATYIANEDTFAASSSVILDSTYAQTSVGVTRWLKVWATAAGWTRSALSAEWSINVPPLGGKDY